MATNARVRTPVHLWIVGILALLWSCFGCYDYLMTRLRNTDYLKSAMPGVDPAAGLAWIEDMPLYAQVGWGLGVWLGLLGSILLLLRNRWAVFAFGLSFIGALLSLGYQLALAPPLAGADAAIYKIMPIVILMIGLGLFMYARAMDKKGVLH